MLLSNMGNSLEDAKGIQPEDPKIKRSGKNTSAGSVPERKATSPGSGRWESGAAGSGGGRAAVVGMKVVLTLTRAGMAFIRYKQGSKHFTCATSFCRRYNYPILQMRKQKHEKVETKEAEAS